MDRPLRFQQEYPALDTFSELNPADNTAGAPTSSARHEFCATPYSPIAQNELGNIRAATLSFRNISDYGPLLSKYLETRKSIFIDQLRWQVGEADGMEFDQYDTPACRWVILHEFGEVIGGVRLVPSTAKCGVYSYMLRDAQRGILDGLPTDVLFFNAPVDPEIWEASRFFVVKGVEASRRLLVQQELFHQMTVVAREGGASTILGIVPSVWARWSRRLGVNATPVGEKFSIDGTISQSVLFNIYNRVE